MTKLYCDKKYRGYMQRLSKYNTCSKDCENCTTKKFWQDILYEAEGHIIHLDEDGYYDVYYVSSVGEGGYDNARFMITYKNGDMRECGLWYNGVCPSVVSEAGEIPEVTRIDRIGYAGKED